MTFVSQLEPVKLWSHFDHILTVPRGSKNEAQMAAYVVEAAQPKWPFPPAGQHRKRGSP